MHITPELLLAAFNELPPEEQEKMRLIRLFPNHFLATAHFDMTVEQDTSPALHSAFHAFSQLCSAYFIAYAMLLWLLSHRDRHSLTDKQILDAAFKRFGARTEASARDGVSRILPADIERIMGISLFPPEASGPTEPRQ